MRALGAPFTPAERAAFVAAARAYIGVRWRHQGRSMRGVDCAGLVICAFRDIGKPFEDADPGYGRQPYNHSLEDQCHANAGDPVQGAPQVGDVAMFRVGTAAPNHVAIVGDYVHGGLSLIHAYAINREVVEAPFDAAWHSKLAAVYRP